MFPCRGCRGVFLNRRVRDYIQTIVNMSATALPFRCVPNNVHDKSGGKSIFRKLILCLKNLHRPPFLGSWQIQSPWEQTFRATTKHTFQRDSMGHVSKTIGWVEEERKKIKAPHYTPCQDNARQATPFSLFPVSYHRKEGFANKLHAGHRVFDKDHT